MVGGNPQTTPESAAEDVLSGDIVAVDARADGRWAVVVGWDEGILAFALCRLEGKGWTVEDFGEMAAAPDSSRSTWISLLEEDESGPNVGVDIAWGHAPAGVTRGVLRGAATEWLVPAVDGTYWLVRWEMPDPTENDDDAHGFELTAA
jgi:hypothetical protein